MPTPDVDMTIDQSTACGQALSPSADLLFKDWSRTVRPACLRSLISLAGSCHSYRVLLLQVNLVHLFLNLNLKVTVIHQSLSTYAVMPPTLRQVHRLMFYVVLAGATAAAAEGIWRQRVLPALGRAFFVLLQGTWFFQISFILFTPEGWPGHYWNVDSPRHVRFVCIQLRNTLCRYSKKITRFIIERALLHHSFPNRAANRHSSRRQTLY